MGIEQYTVPATQQLCWTCKNALGGCPWTEYDPIENRVKFEPIPGWTAEPRRRSAGHRHDGREIWLDSYRITACPMYDEEPQRGEPTCET